MHSENLNFLYALYFLYDSEIRCISNLSPCVLVPNDLVLYFRFKVVFDSFAGFGNFSHHGFVLVLNVVNSR